MLRVHDTCRDNHVFGYFLVYVFEEDTSVDGFFCWPPFPPTAWLKLDLM